MQIVDKKERSFQTATDRWASVGPYYAMFPIGFAFDVIRTHTKVGDRVLDPFAGRGSSIYAAAALDRVGCGIEINPVGWLYSATKLRPAAKEQVMARLGHLMAESLRLDLSEVDLPEFYIWAYSRDVLRFLLTARRDLRWRANRVDATLMVFLLIYLHGRRASSLSNQMRDSKAMAPDYAVRWWRERDLTPPEIDPVEFLSKRIEWRYKKGRPTLNGKVYRGDSLGVLFSERKKYRSLEVPFDFLFTSPPYFGVTNYYYDQWLRLWMLGGPSLPHRQRQRWKRKFESQDDYRHLLSCVFKGAAGKLAKDAIIYVRTDARQFTLDTTVASLVSAFPAKKIDNVSRPLTGKSQTALFGDSSKKPGEVDLILTPR